MIIIVVLVIAVSAIYKTKFVNVSLGTNSNLPDFAKTRKVVSLWVKGNYFYDDIAEQIENYNIMNKDNIYIKSETYGGDYVNMLRMKLLTSNEPDIFDIGNYDIMKNDKLDKLNNIGVNMKSIPNNKKLSYKNNVVGINISGNVVKFAWNKDIFKKCGLNPENGPKTWQEVMDYAKIIKEKMPQITPFEAPFSGYGEFKRSIGEASVNSDTITTTFWNYKKGVYDYSSSKYIFNFYRDMYKNNLMSKELEGNTRDKVREDFYNGTTAMFVSFYDDKVKFLSVNPLNFNIGISNLPKIKSYDSQNYYYVDDVKSIAVNALSGSRPEVKKVFDWYANTCNDITKVTPYKYKSKYFPELSGYDDTSNYKFEDKDPTPALNFGQKKIKDLVYSCISGETSTDETISELNKYLNDYCKEVKATDNAFFNSFIGEE